MPTMMVRYKAAEAGVPEVLGAVEAAFAALKARGPEGVRFAYYRRPGTSEFVALLELDAGVENPLPGIEAARGLQATVARWAMGTAPSPEPLELIASHDSRR
ncbi:hypothetical protein LY474_18690 [Myxococcus stipitatus]|uniref:hypothetical protein n=1 Tax=Myxococcus stipitatus TaxID=83455 RepID=UPI001F1B92AD|nr:hypothetical protein [Myxococcus stipitatus]MCE9669828.1 hypothetical protein [Myxococcus stipitatus]